MKCKKALLPILSIAIASLLVGCTGGNANNNQRNANNQTVLKGITFNGMESLSGNALNNFINKPFSSDSENPWNNEASDYSIIVSPYYTITNSGETISYPVYSANSTYGLESFCYINVHNYVETSFVINYPSPIIDSKTEIIHHASVEPSYTVQSKKFIVRLPEIGQYTFIFNNEKEKALTIFLSSTKDFETFAKDYDDYKITTLNPGTYNDVITIDKPKSLYHLTAGKYKIRRFDFFADNIAIFMDDGVYIEAIMPTLEDERDYMHETDGAGKTRWKFFFNGIPNRSNDAFLIRYRGLVIEGNAIIDLSKLDWHARGGLGLDGNLDVRLANFTITNAPEWTMHLRNGQNINVDNVKIFGYRQNSDGFCLDTCLDSTVTNCFARSGDDLFEVKSVYVNQTDTNYCTNNVTFSNCTAWPEKTRAFGIISEIVNDVSDVYFKNNIVIGQSDNIDSIVDSKSNLLSIISSSLIVLVEHENPSTVENVVFEDIKIYDSSTYPFTVVNNGERSNNPSVTDVYEVRNIYFKNIEVFSSTTTERNNKLRVHCAKEDSILEGIYLENITINDVKINKDNLQYNYSGYFDANDVHIS